MSEIDVRGKEFKVKLGDRELTLKRLSDASHSRLNTYVQQRMMSIAEASTIDMEPSTRDQILSLTIREVSVATFFSPLGLKHAKTPEGLAVLVSELSGEKLDVSLFQNPVIVSDFNKEFLRIQRELFNLDTNGASKKS